MILSFAEFVRTYDSSSKLHLVGGGAMLESLKLMVDELGLRNNSFLWICAYFESTRVDAKF